MDILSLFLIVPLITIAGLVFTRSLEKARLVSLIGSLVQLGMAINLVFAYMKERETNDAIMLFTRDIMWFEPFNIHYAVGVDGISVTLLVLTAIVVLAGVFISWKMEDLPKEFFISLIVLAIAGVWFSARMFSDEKNVLRA